MDTKQDNSLNKTVGSYEMVVWDLEPMFKMIDSLPLKSLAFLRYSESKGFSTDNAYIYTNEGVMAQELRLVQEELIDDFIVYSINSFEFVYISRPSLSKLTEKERRWFVENERAVKFIYETLRFNTELAGRFIRYQRIGKSIFLITPKN